MTSLKNIFRTTPQRIPNFLDVQEHYLPDVPSTTKMERRIVIAAIFEFLQKNLPHQEWFIGGSAAHTGVFPFNDVDVFFADEQKAIEATKHIANMHRKGEDLLASPDIFSTPTSAIQVLSQGGLAPVTIENMYQTAAKNINLTAKVRNAHEQITIQFVTRNTGTYKEIFKRIDLNVCKAALLPTGQKVLDSSASEPLTIDRIQFQTVSRMVKYVGRVYPKDQRQQACYRAAKDAIDRFIEDATLTSDAQDFYEFRLSNDKDNAITVNSLLKRQIYDVFQPNSDVIKYFKEQALQRAPELLL